MEQKKLKKKLKKLKLNKTLKISKMMWNKRNLFILKTFNELLSIYTFLVELYVVLSTVAHVGCLTKELDGLWQLAS